MSSKVVNGAAAAGAQPLQWARVPVQGKAAGHLPSEPQALETSGADVAGLKQRIAQLEAELPLRERRGYEAGQRDGSAAVRSQEGARVEETIQRLARTIHELSLSKAKLRRDAEEDLVRLSLAIARRVLHREIQVDQETLLGVVKAALSKIEARELQRVRLSPRDAEGLRAALERLCGRSVEVEADATLEKGAVILETVRGELDASLETQLREIEQGLVELVHRKH